MSRGPEDSALAAQRVFFAVWPNEAARARLADLGRALVERSGGKATPADKIHLTLAFLGDVAPDRLRGVLELGAGIRAQAFRLRLDQAGSFRRARIGWAGCARVPAELAQLHGALAAALRRAGCEVEDRPYSPHVTLVRRLARPIPRHAVGAVEWDVAEFALVRSDLGRGRYETLAAWRLG